MYGKITVCCIFVVWQVVDKTTDEAEIIMQYVKNTHAATHNTYTLEVQEVTFIYLNIMLLIMFLVYSMFLITFANLM